MRIVTVWRSRADLDHYLASRTSLRGQPHAAFQGNPIVDVHELVLDSTTAWWP